MQEKEGAQNLLFSGKFKQCLMQLANFPIRGRFP